MSSSSAPDERIEEINQLATAPTELGLEEALGVLRGMLDPYDYPELANYERGAIAAVLAVLEHR